MHREIDTLTEFDHWVARHPDPRQSVALQGLDLRDRAESLASVSGRGLVFLGCSLPDEAVERLRGEGALFFPKLPDLPFEAYRNGLHTAEELYAGLDQGYEQTPDAKVYAWTRSSSYRSLQGSLAAALHDHSVTDALEELVEEVDSRRCVGIMGGHAAERGSETYAAAARLGAKLAGSGHMVMTGGGPGAMEAANLGARLHADPAALDRALDVLALVPRFTPPDQGGQGIAAWARQALGVLEQFPLDGRSIGIPTWFYGHEPPNPFASHIAKYFSNALREDILLQLCRGGIIYLSGAAGTVQEVFQTATGNYYSAPGTRPTPMVLVGIEHWTTRIPAWPLLAALGRDRPMGEHIHLVDTVDDAWAILQTSAPRTDDTPESRSIPH